MENAPSGRKLSFSLPEDDTDCSVNKVGTLTGKTTTGECPVTLLIQAEGYVDKSIVSTVTVKDEQNATWEGFPEWKQWRQTGETISPGDVANEDGTVEKIFTSSEPSRCLIDQSTGVLTVAGEGSCEVSLTLRASGFITKIFKTNLGNLIYDEAKQNQLNPLTTSNPYGEIPSLSIPNNISLSIANAPTGKGAISYRSTTVGTCEVDAGTGAVSAIGPGNCVIQAQAAGENSPPSVWTEILNTEIPSTLPDLDAIVGFAYSSLTPKLSDPTPTLTAPYGTNRCRSRPCLFHNSTGHNLYGFLGRCSLYERARKLSYNSSCNKGRTQSLFGNCNHHDFRRRIFCPDMGRISFIHKVWHRSSLKHFSRLHSSGR